jgi:lipopolysaccharide export system protein LptA
MIRRPLLALLFASSGLLHGADAPVPAPPTLTTPGAPAVAPLPIVPIPVVPTVIESAGPADMVSTATETIFTFRDSVTVTATNLKLSCDQLVVVAKRTGDPKATLGKQENFKSLIATGNVRLLQSDREALCDRAEVLPGEDKVILTGNPASVRSSDGRYAGSGPEMILERGQQRAVIKTPRFVLPPLKDLGPGKDKGKDNKAAPLSPAANPPAISPEPSSTTITVPLPATPPSPK